MFGSKKKELDELVNQQEQEIQLLRNRTNELTEKLVRFQGKEEAIINALTTAQDTASRTVNDAERKRDEILTEAKTRGDAIINEAQEMLDNTKRECAELLSRTGDENQRMLANARSEAERIKSAAKDEAEMCILKANESAKATGNEAERLKAEFAHVLSISTSKYKEAARTLSDVLNSIANEAAAKADSLRVFCEKNNSISDELNKLNVYSESDFDMLAKHKSEKVISTEANDYSNMIETYASENEEGELTETAVVSGETPAPASITPPCEAEKVWTVDEVEKTVPTEAKLRSNDELSILLNEVLRD